MNDDLRTEANDWLLRLHAAPSSDDVKAHEHWLGRSAAHRLAWRDAERSWAMLGALGTDTSAVERDIARFVRNRRAVRAAMTAAAAAVLIAGNWAFRPLVGVATLADASTKAGEVRAIRLDDGTRIVMNGATSLDWHFASGRRDVTLEDGDAYFEVAHDTARPFNVTAGPARIRVTGTRFSVRRTGSGVALELAEGRVLASSGTDASQVPVAIAPGQSVIWSDGGPMRLSSVERNDVGAWRKGRLIVRSRRLGDVAADLQRWWPGRVIVMGSVADLCVTGVFRPADIDRTVADLEQSLPVRITRLGPLMLVRARP